MSQLNMHVKPEFERTLLRFMRVRGLATKAEAIRVAVEEALQRATCRGGKTDFSSWIGAGARAPQNPAPRFVSDDDLWN